MILSELLSEQKEKDNSPLYIDNATNPYINLEVYNEKLNLDKINHIVETDSIVIFEL